MYIKKSQTKVWFVAEADQIETIMSEGIKSDPADQYIQLITKLEFRNSLCEIYVPELFAFLNLNNLRNKYVLLEIDIKGIKGSFVKVKNFLLRGLIGENFKNVKQSLIEPKFISHYEEKDLDFEKIIEYNYFQLMNLIYDDPNSPIINLNHNYKSRRMQTLKNKLLAERYAALELNQTILCGFIDYINQLKNSEIELN